LLESERRYQHLELAFVYRTNADQKLLLLQRFSPTLVNLNIQIADTKISSKLPEKLSFPKLKTLKWKGPDSKNFILNALTDSINLEKLSIEVSVVNPNMLNSIMKFKNLKELELLSSRENYFKVEELQEAQFKLVSLSISCKESELKPQTRKNFDKFVLSMADTLTSMKFEWCKSDEIDLVLNKLPALKRFESNYVSGCHTRIEKRLKPNQTIKELTINNHSWMIQKEILACFKGLEFIKFSYVSVEDFNWIVRNMKGLKKLQAEPRPNFNIAAHYNTLKAEDPSINGNIEIIVSK
jgi:hypothetical protein